ncbi:MAG: hypothetical protein GY765_31180 [bacterium]|nr:hypothetical protein [bacterium]
MDIKLNFINQSNDPNNSSVVIFQKNVATNFDELAVAWQVIKNCGASENQSFTYPEAFTVGATGKDGDTTSQVPAAIGDSFEVQGTPSENSLVKTGTAANPGEVEIKNALPSGAIAANIYKDGKLLSTNQNVAPEQKAIFKLERKLHIGVVPGVEEGDVMDSAIICTVNTELDLLGVSSADIVMTGGGTGPSSDAKTTVNAPGANSTPFTFTLQNVVMG